MNIQITGKTGTFDVTDLVPSVKWSGDYRQAARSLSFSVVSSPADKRVPAVDCPLGANVQLMAGGKALFDGFIVSRGKNTEKGEITLSCFDRGFYLSRNKGYYKFVNTPPEQIAARVAADFGIQMGTLAETGAPVSRIFAGVPLYKIIATAYTLASRVTGGRYHIGFRGARLFVTEKGPDERTLVIAGKSMSWIPGCCGAAGGSRRGGAGRPDNAGAARHGDVGHDDLRAGIRHRAGRIRLDGSRGITQKSRPLAAQMKGEMVYGF